jgi:fatty acid desaturase
VALATHDELTNDPIAWPTLIVFAISLVAYLLPLYFFWDRPTYWTVPITCVSSYAMFTAMHEACHRAISAEHRWLNEGVGYVAVAICFQAPFRAFRYIHLSHHKYTNDPEKDP